MIRRLRNIGIGIATVLLVLVAVVAVLCFSPLTDPDLRSKPDPAGSYGEASDRIDAVLEAEGREDLIPEASSISLLAGSRTETCVVIFHGYTSVPRQFRLIAQGYRDAGCNVWVPRLPYHGNTDRLTEDFSKLTATGLRDFADDQIDIASGLGENVVVIGFSGGGSLATWSAVERDEVAQTILISPLLHPQGYEEWQDRPLVRALRLLPFDVYNWWNPKVKDSDIKGYNYPRFSLKGIAALLSLSHWTDSRMDDEKYPADDPVLLIRNNGDQRLDSAFNERFVKRLAAPDDLTVYRIPASAGLLHNFISPEEFGESHEHISDAYEYLSDALGIPLPDPEGVEPESAQRD